MFKIDDYVAYGVNGVCRVVDVCPSPFDKTDTRSFYVLKPLFAAAASNATIYTPVDIEARRLRPLIDRAEAESLLNSAETITAVDIGTEKNRRHVYQETMATCDVREYARILKTVRRRRTEAAALRKNLPDVDIEFESKAKKCLYGELSVVLGVPFESFEGKI